MFIHMTESDDDSHCKWCKRKLVMKIIIHFGNLDQEISSYTALLPF